jgi:hypothetical protein
MPSLQTRIIKIFLNAIQTERNATFAIVFGAIYALSEIGAHVFENFVFPLIKKIGERVTQALDSPASSYEEKSAIMLRDLITVSASLEMLNLNLSTQASEQILFAEVHVSCPEDKTGHARRTRPAHHRIWCLFRPDNSHQSEQHSQRGGQKACIQHPPQNNRNSSTNSKMKALKQSF